MNGRRPTAQTLIAVAGCMALVAVVGAVASAIDPEEGVSLADVTGVAFTAVLMAGSLLLWTRDAAAPPAGSADDVPPRPARPEPPVPRQLPRAVTGFAGRSGELSALTALLEESPTEPSDAARAVVLSAVDGSAGIGKTTLVVAWAHGVAHRFPDGQLFVNLRGFDPSAPPMSPAEAVRGFLDAFEVPAGRIPAGLEAQASLYRSILAGRRVLVVLDNARDAAQVRPLLPGSGGCFVLVTSRHRLTSLVAVDGARPLGVDLLPVAEARELLAHRIGAARVAAEPAAVEEIITLCARLPLALSVVAARAERRTPWSLAALAEQLRQARGGLQAFEDGDVHADVRAVLSWSYARLDPGPARLFRLLGLHPGPDVTPAAAASLAGTDPARTRRTLAELADAHLVAEQVPGRFGCHDPLRAYAAELVRSRDGDAERDAARERLLDHYLHSAHAMNRSLHPRDDPVPIPGPGPGVTPETATDHRAALAWFEAEHTVLMAAVQLAATTGHERHAWQLPQALNEFLLRRGHWSDRTTSQETALDAARRSGDVAGQAVAHGELGRALAWHGRFEEAHDHLHRALDLFVQLGDTTRRADTYGLLSSVLEQQGDPAAALEAARRAFELFQAAGSRRGVAQGLNKICWYHAMLGQPEPALSAGEEALRIQAEVGNIRGQANTLDNLGLAHHLLGDHDRATEFHGRAVAVTRELGDRHGLAAKLDHLGDAALAAGHAPVARDAWREALTTLDGLGVVRVGLGPGYPDAEEIAAKLHRLGGS